MANADSRMRLKQYLDQTGIGTGIHYPIPLHLQKPYRSLGYIEGDFPVAEKAACEILSLPMYPQLQWDQQRRIASAVHDFISAKMSVVGP